eukprot:907048-Ditylum_brightwellii.AAC.1
MSNAAGKMQPVKVSANQIFHNFNKLAYLYSGLSKNMKGKQIKKFQTMTLSSPCMETARCTWSVCPQQSLCLTIMGCSQAKFPTRTSGVTLRLITLSWLWANTLAYQLSLATSISGLTQKKDDVPNNQGFEPRVEGLLPVVTLLKDCKEDEEFITNIEQCLDLVKNLYIAAWLKDHPNWVDLDAMSSTRASKSLHAAACAHSVVSVQDASVATSSTSPEERVAQHNIWGAVLDTSGASPCIVLHAVAPDFEDILCALGSKNDRTRMLAESLNSFYEEMAHNTCNFLFKLTSPPHIGNFFVTCS